MSDPRAVVPVYSASRWVLAAFAGISCVLYLLMPRIAQGLALATPSFLSEVFPWVSPINRDTLVRIHEAGGLFFSAFVFAAVNVALFAIYLLALRAVRTGRDPCGPMFIIGSGVVFLGIHLFSPVLLSSDVYSYALYGRMLSVYGVSPYIENLAFAATDPFANFVGDRYLPSWYGPLWSLVSAGITHVTGEHMGLTVLVFRCFGLCLAIAIAVLIRQILLRIEPRHTALGVLLFLWNPLVVLETGFSAHNDMFMLIFVMLAVWLHLRGWKTAAVLALTLSALVKFLTGMLLPLYLLLVLRELPAWRERWKFLLLSIGGAALVSLPIVVLSKSSAGSPTSQAVISVAFYDNNFHELIFKGLRRVLGEDAVSVSQRIYFQGWWSAAKGEAEFREEATGGGSAVSRLRPGSRVLVIANPSTEQARVYNPETRSIGQVNLNLFEDSDRPAQAAGDPMLIEYERMVKDRRLPKTANAWIRAVTWLLFAAFGLLAARRTTNLKQFLVWSAAALLTSIFLIITEIWPWYENWALVLGALAPDRLPARFAVILSACVPSLYITIGFQGSDFPWIYSLRSLPAFVLPLFIFLALLVLKAVRRPLNNAGNP
ncbi:MAG: hypothetical protein EXS36_10005 [Pedosphaera sp.]|nr:hypothetical protein [Pedosphaera sp.]